MKNIGICYSEQAVKVSNSHCSNHAFSSSRNSDQTSIQNAVTSIYRVKLSDGKQFLINLTWSNPLNQGFSIFFSDFPASSSKNIPNTIILRKARGTKTLDSCGSRIEIYWDLCRAQYDSGPEPINGFYVVILVDSELSLILGDMDQEIWDIKKRVSGVAASQSILVSRTEYLSGSSCVYSTRVKFCDVGICHDILIKCIVGEELKSSILSVYIDKKRVIHVKRLQWNFRGNQIIFLDGLLVDLMWDLYDWFFSPSSSSPSPSSSAYGVFLFRTRSGLDSRLWLEEKNYIDHQINEQGKNGLSLLIFACKNPD